MTGQAGVRDGPEQRRARQEVAFSHGRNSLQPPRSRAVQNIELQPIILWSTQRVCRVRAALFWTELTLWFVFCNTCLCASGE